MVCVCSLLFKLTYFGVVLGFPGYQVYLLNKDGKTVKEWLLYFMVLSVCSLLEYTVLFPVKFLLGKICSCMFQSLVAGFAFWLYYPKFGGLQLLENLGGKYIDLAYTKINPAAGKFLEKLGIPNRDEEGAAKKGE